MNADHRFEVLVLTAGEIADLIANVCEGDVSRDDVLRQLSQLLCEQYAKQYADCVDMAGHCGEEEFFDQFDDLNVQFAQRLGFTIQGEGDDEEINESLDARATDAMNQVMQQKPVDGAAHADDSIETWMQWRAQ